MLVHILRWDYAQTVWDLVFHLAWSVCVVGLRLICWREIDILLCAIDVLVDSVEITHWDGIGRFIWGGCLLCAKLGGVCWYRGQWRMAWYSCFVPSSHLALAVMFLIMSLADGN